MCSAASGVPGDGEERRPEAERTPARCSAGRPRRLAAQKKNQARGSGGAHERGDERGTRIGRRSSPTARKSSSDGGSFRGAPARYFDGPAARFELGFAKRRKIARIRGRGYL